MRLDNTNCSNPALWGRDLQWVIDGKLIEPNDFKLQIPDEIDFLKEFHGNYWPTAKEYFKA